MPVAGNWGRKKSLPQPGGPGGRGKKAQNPTRKSGLAKSESQSVRGERTREIPAPATPHLRGCPGGTWTGANARRVPMCMCVCARACVCMCVRACRGLAPGQPRTPDRAGISTRAVLARPAPYLQAPLCLLQRERRIDTADGAGAAASRPPLNVCVCARVAASSSPAPSQREYSTEARGTQGGGQGSGGRNQSLRDLTAPLAASRVGGMSNRKVGKCG